MLHRNKTIPLSPGYYLRRILALIATVPVCLSGTPDSAEIISTLSDTVGSSYEVSGSGSSSNTADWVEGEVGRFAIEIDGVTRYLTVSAEDLGGLTPSEDTLMVAQTVDSQGMDDTGTLSIYFRPAPGSGELQL